MSESTPDLDAQKRDAAEQAVKLVRSGMVIGLGTGSTATLAVEGIGRAIKSGKFESVVGIATSNRTRELAVSLGIPLSTLEQHPKIDLTIDGADEVDPAGNLIKGGGGALLREKIVAAVSRRLVIVVDETKLVARFGLAFPLPVAVTEFGSSTHELPLRDIGAEATLRLDAAGAPFRTDDGHLILDCKFEGGIPDPQQVERVLKARPGVVETGLFLDMHPDVIVGSEEGQ